MEIEIAPLPQVGGRQAVALRRLPRLIVSDRGRKIPRTDVLANVAAVGVIADLRALRLGDRAVDLDGQV